MADYRKAPDRDDLVIEHVRRRTANCINHTIYMTQERFLDGVLLTVGFDGPEQEDGARARFINRVFVQRRSINVYGHDDDLLRIVGEVHSRSFYEFFANGDVVSGIIALLVTIMIVPSFIASYWTGSEISVPAWITSGWLLILGFYFGKASSKPD
ncbi:hypothetical protein [Aureimonas sp. AU4]|uniref:hypothetical protein n=1 Tax=Aureimonas sp. AU4 TaxID=1638163 RepID=UPI000AD0A23F|nr:hypothetical protein [Aureimonas sp. AU4]